MGSKFGVAILSVLVALFLILAFYIFLKTDDFSDTLKSVINKRDPVLNSYRPADYESPFDINVNKKYTATLKTTKGDIVIWLNVKDTPITANNFVFLARKNFYDNTIFHRVIKGFMVQGGDSNGDGTGGPGYRFADEPFDGEYTRGTVAMANAGPDTNGSQFFIMHEDYPLPKKYVIFGRVLSGMDVVDAIAETQVVGNQSGELSQPLVPIVVADVDIQER